PLHATLPRPVASEPAHDRAAARGPPRPAHPPRRAVRGGQRPVGAVRRASFVAAPEQNRYHAAPPDGGGGVLHSHPPLRRHRDGCSDHYHRGGVRGRAGRRRGAGDRRAAGRQRRGRRRRHPPAARRRFAYRLRIKPHAYPAAVRVGGGDAAAHRRTHPMAEASRLITQDLDATPLTIAIVTWNSERWIERCLISLLAACAGVAHEIVVYDNASTDRTLQLIGDDATLLRGASNAGFA